MKFVYFIEDETLGWGAWTDPREAARRYLGYRKEPDPDLDAESMIQVEITEMVEKMLDTPDFPILVKVPIDPEGAPKSFGLDRYHH